MIEPTDVDGLSAALELALLDTALRARLIEQGRQRAAKYTWQGAAELLLQVYKKVAAA